jgi:LL-diaminopimelate aminotransferase
MSIKTADRIASVQEYYFSKKMREIALLNEAGKAIINLGIGSPDLPPDQTVIDALIGSAQNPKHHSYQSYKGILALRTAISNWYQSIYNVALDAEKEVLPLLGSKEGIMHISMTYINPGDEVLIPDPSYPTYVAATHLAGGKVVKYQLQESKEWHPSVANLEALITPKTKLIWLNYPNMPTGQQTNLRLLSAVLNLAKKHNILVCNDNPYSLTLNEQPSSIFQIEGAKEIALELNSLSKSHHMAGWRMGWVSGNEQRIHEILKFKSNMDSGMFLPIQHAAIAALNVDQSVIQNNNKIYAKRRVLAWELLDVLGCSTNKNQVGMFVWAKIPSNQTDATTFSDTVLHDARVFVTPGPIFGENGNDYIRISLCSNEEVLKEAIYRIKKMRI